MYILTINDHFGPAVESGPRRRIRTPTLRDMKFKIFKRLYTFTKYAVSFYSVPIRVNKKNFKHNIHLHYMTVLSTP